MDALAASSDIHAHLVRRDSLRGLGRARHALSEHAQAEQANVPAVMIDADEFALYVSQIPSLGPVLGRAISIAGVGLASYASLQAYGGIGDDLAARRNAVQLNDATARRRDRPLVTGDADSVRGMERLWRQEVLERTCSIVANALMLPGSLLMDANLLASSLLLGGLFEGLVPWGTAAMGPAVVCMAAYGFFVAGKAVCDIVTARAAGHRLLQLEVAPGLEREGMQQLLGRMGQLQRIDSGLCASGLGQAIGAVAMYTLGPIWLVPLLAGTIGLAIGKYIRAEVAGQWPVTPVIDAALRPDAPALACPPACQELVRLAEIEREMQTLARLEKSARGRPWWAVWHAAPPAQPAPSAALAQYLGVQWPAAGQGTTQCAQSLLGPLSQRLHEEGLFGAVAQTLANDGRFAQLVPPPTWDGHLVRPSDLLRAVTAEGPKSHERLEAVSIAAIDALVPLIRWRRRQTRALYDAHLVATLA